MSDSPARTAVDMAIAEMHLSSFVPPHQHTKAEIPDQRPDDTEYILASRIYGE